MTTLKMYVHVDRAVKMATTYVKKAEDALHWPGAPSPPLVGYWSLLDEMLDAAVEIVERLQDDYFVDTNVEDFLGLGVGTTRYNMSDDLLERAEKLLVVVKRRREQGQLARRIELLENTEGRTPEEAAAYREKATELRARSASR